MGTTPPVQDARRDNPAQRDRHDFHGSGVPLLVRMEGHRPIRPTMNPRPYYLPLGITKEEAARAYVEQGSFYAAGVLLGCHPETVRHHVHRTTTKVRRQVAAFKHVRTPQGGIVRVRLSPGEEPRDTVPRPTR